MARDGNHKSATVHHVAAIHVTKISQRASCQSLSIDMAIMKRSKGPLNSFCKRIRDNSACTSESTSHEKEKIWWLHLQQDMFYIEHSSSKISKYTHLEKSKPFLSPKHHRTKTSGAEEQGVGGAGEEITPPQFCTMRPCPLKIYMYSITYKC